MSVVKYIKNYVFARQLERGQKVEFMHKFKALMVSAFWHGTEPVFYILFVMMAFLNDMS